MKYSSGVFNISKIYLHLIMWKCLLKSNFIELLRAIPPIQSLFRYSVLNIQTAHNVRIDHKDVTF